MGRAAGAAQAGGFEDMDPVARSKAAMAAAEAARRQRIGIDRPPAPRKPLGMSKAEWRRVRNEAAAAEQLIAIVNSHAQAHGAYEHAEVVDLGGEDGEGRQKIFQAVLNRGGTAVERWFVNDSAGLFDEPQRQAVRYCRSLWARAGGVTAIDPAADRVDGVEGWSQQEALDELHDLKHRVPARYWNVFENVCRFDEEAGVAGSALAGNKRSAVDAAKTTVALVASLIAMWRRL